MDAFVLSVVITGVNAKGACHMLNYLFFNLSNGHQCIRDLLMIICPVRSDQYYAALLQVHMC